MRPRGCKPQEIYEKFYIFYNKSVAIYTFCSFHNVSQPEIDGKLPMSWWCSYSRDFPNLQMTPNLPTNATRYKTMPSDPFYSSSKPHSRIAFSFKCLPPADLFYGRPDCKDAHHFQPIYARSEHLEGYPTSHPSQSPTSTETLSPTATISPLSLDLLHHDMHGIIHHFLALLNTTWQRLLR